MNQRTERYRLGAPSMFWVRGYLMLFDVPFPSLPVWFPINQGYGVHWFISYIPTVSPFTSYKYLKPHTSGIKSSLSNSLLPAFIIAPHIAGSSPDPRPKLLLFGFLSGRVVLRGEALVADGLILHAWLIPSGVHREPWLEANGDVNGRRSLKIMNMGMGI